MAFIPKDDSDFNLEPLDDLGGEDSLGLEVPTDLASVDLAGLDLGSVDLGQVSSAPSNLAASNKAPVNTVPIDRAQVAVATNEVIEEEVGGLPKRKGIWTAVPAWTVSMTVHISILLILASISFEPIQGAISAYISGGAVTEDSEGSEEFDVEAAADDVEIAKAESEEVPESMPQVEVAGEISTTEMKLDMAMTATMPTTSMQSLTQQLTPSSMLTAQGASLKKTLSGRSTKMKREMLERFGGTKDSEKAVSMALKWLAAHQLRDGSWSFDHAVACDGKCKNAGAMREARNAATGLALLPFLGAGQTHMEGEYKETVYRGLSFLLDTMKVEKGEFPTGSWHEGGSNMYGHGIASIAVCEAYAMTGDETLASPAQLCLNFISYAQNPEKGGWQYTPRVGGDTSVVGWQLMALKSGAMGGLVVQIPTLKKAEYFLDSVQINSGAFYGYTEPDGNIDGHLATSACGLLCRMYMGWQKQHPALVEGVNYLNKKGPDLTNMYYNYYATQVMKQQGGDVWESWNPRMRDQLVKAQDSTGHAAGSWYFPDNSVGDPANQGGRLYLTCMSTMILEVYYRHMPIYGEQTEEDAFKF